MPFHPRCRFVAHAGLVSSVKRVCSSSECAETPARWRSLVIIAGDRSLSSSMTVAATLRRRKRRQQDEPQQEQHTSANGSGNKTPPPLPSALALELTNALGHDGNHDLLLSPPTSARSDHVRTDKTTSRSDSSTSSGASVSSDVEREPEADKNDQSAVAMTATNAAASPAAKRRRKRTYDTRKVRGWDCDSQVLRLLSSVPLQSRVSWQWLSLAGGSLDRRCCHD